MSSSFSIRPADRSFLEGIREVAFRNPFAAETRAIHRKLSGLGNGASMPEVYREVHMRLSRVLDEWLPGGICRMKDVVSEERQTVTFALLYRLLLDAIPVLDPLIEQWTDGGGPQVLEFPEGEALCASLGTMGYSRAEAAKRVGVFFQIRRAYYQLDRRLVGHSQGMEDLRRRLWRNIFTADIGWYVQGLWERMEDFSLLLLGETGTGKGLAASAVGRSVYMPYDFRQRAFVSEGGKAFQEVNLSAFAPGVLESELFGHRKGAFTGAIEDASGVLASCPPYGSVFLDEVGELSEAVQVKLLRVLQERRFSPVGSREEQRFTGRVITATNRPLSELQGEEGLREDFLYRISSDRIQVPPLRERLSSSPEELRHLAAHVLQRMTGWDGGDDFEGVLQRLDTEVPETYSWPGNVRELEQALRRILLTGSPGLQPGTAVVTLPVHERPDIPNDLKRLPKQARVDVVRRLMDAYGSYAEVARLTGLDRRTVKSWLDD